MFALKRRSDRSEESDESRPPQFKVGKCPSCGRESAIVFPLVRSAGPPADAPLVCLDCCPRKKIQSDDETVV